MSLTHVRLPRRTRIVLVLACGVAGCSQRVNDTTAFPSSPQIAQNTLRLHLRFDRPMQRGVAHRHLRMRDSSGVTLSKMIRKLQTELWSADGSMLTILLNPGAIKTGVGPRKRSGPQLRIDDTVQLLVSPAWPDSTGRALGSQYQKTYDIIAPLTTGLNPGNWVISRPTAESNEGLVIQFDRPLDRVSLTNAFMITKDGSATPVRGHVGEEERSIVLTPLEPWDAEAHYALRVHPHLEDPAGNRVNVAFEADRLSSKVPATLTVPLSLRTPTGLKEPPR